MPETEVAPPGATHLSGWCNDGDHVGCYGTREPMPWPDPSDRRRTYTIPGKTCSCLCHTRPGTVSPGATKGST